MKIGIFTETYHPTMNGVVVSVDTFKEELERRGHEYFIFAPEVPGRPAKEKNVWRIPSFPTPNNITYPLAIPMPFDMAKHNLPLDIIKDLDIIHIQHYSATGQYGLSCGELFGIPTVYTYHTMAELYTSYAPIIGPAFRPLIQYWTRHTAARADHVVVPTESIKYYLREIGVEEHISVIPTGIDTSLYKTVSRHQLLTQFGIADHEKVLLYVGRLSEEKNIPFLLEAFYRVQLVVPDTHLLFVGDGPDRAKYEAWVRNHHLDRYVHFAGFQPRETTIKLFGAADLFTFPSITDTQGIVIIEAMAAGTPPVAVDRLGPHDIIKDKLTGRLTGLNIEAFSRTIIDLLQHHDKRDKLGLAARHQAKQYDKKVTAEAMETLYERITHHLRPKAHSQAKS